MECKEANKKMWFYAEGSLLADENRDMEQHLAYCRHCRQQFEGFSGIMEEIRERQTATSNPFLYTRVMEQLNGPDRPAWNWQPRWLYLLSLPAMAVLGIWLGLQWFHPSAGQGANQLANQVEAVSSGEAYLLDDLDEDLYVAYFEINTQE